MKELAQALLLVHDRRYLHSKIVGWEVHYNETGEQAAELL
jgi:hypothetical protein